MANPEAPIIVLGSDNRVGAFLTTPEAVDHTTNAHGLEERTDSLEFFDARSRRLVPVIDKEGKIRDLQADDEEDHTEYVRECVRKRAARARSQLEGRRREFAVIDESPLTLADDAVEFDTFAWKLASVLRPSGSPSDPEGSGGGFGMQHDGGFWHNLFSH